MTAVLVMRSTIAHISCETQAQKELTTAPGVRTSKYYKSNDASSRSPATSPTRGMGFERLHVVPSGRPLEMGVLDYPRKLSGNLIQLQLLKKSQISSLFGMQPSSVGFLVSTIAPKWAATSLNNCTKQGAQVSLYTFHISIPLQRTPGEVMPAVMTYAEDCVQYMRTLEVKSFLTVKKSMYIVDSRGSYMLFFIRTVNTLLCDNYPKRSI